MKPCQTMKKFLQRKRHFKAIHWDPSKLTHFNSYFDEDSLRYPRQNTLIECVALLRSERHALKCRLRCRIFLSAGEQFKASLKRLSDNMVQRDIWRTLDRSLLCREARTLETKFSVRRYICIVPLQSIVPYIYIYIYMTGGGPILI